MDHLSIPANKLIEQEFTKNNIFSIHESIESDGNADLWDLYVITFENDDYTYYNYHWENWHDNDPHEYQLYFTCLTQHLSPNDYHLEMAHELVMMIEDHHIRDKILMKMHVSPYLVGT